MADLLDYNEKYRQRTKRFALDIILFYTEHCKRSEELRIIGKQMLRSGTSVAANFRAYTRGRSDAERFAKMCIVVEEADETQLWLELLEESNLVSHPALSRLKQEAEELVKIFTASRTRMKR